MDIILNNIKAIVKNIDSVDELNIVTFTFKTYELTMMSLELPSSIIVGTNVILGAKPSHISIAKDLNIEISYSNKIKTKIIDIISGQLLSTIIMSIDDTKIESLITLKSLKSMNLQVGDEILTLIKSSELFIKEVIND